jgi:hypothetical protein
MNAMTSLQLTQIPSNVKILGINWEYSQNDQQNHYADCEQVLVDLESVIKYRDAKQDAYDLPCLVDFSGNISYCIQEGKVFLFQAESPFNENPAIMHLKTRLIQSGFECSPETIYINDIAYLAYMQ